MTFTKKKIAAAIGGTLLAAVSSQGAFAVDVDDSANAGVLLPTETILTTSSKIVPSAAPAETFELFGTLTANNIPASTDIRVTISLNGGYTFGAAPTLILADSAGGTTASTDIAEEGGSAGAIPTFAVFTGGGTADSTVTFNANTGSAEVVGGAHFLFELDGADGLLTGGAQSTITADVSIQIADNFGPTDLPGFSAEPYISWSPLGSLAADATSTTSDDVNIDVSQDSLFFSDSAGDVDQNVGGFRMVHNTAVITEIDGATAANLATIVGTAAPTIIAANGFSAFDFGTVGSGITFAGDGATCSISTSDATMAECGAYTPAPTGDAAQANDITMAVGTANTVRIAETTLVASVAATGADTASYSVSTVTGSVNLASLSRNGSSARLNFALTPGGAYPMYIRVSNPSAVTGPATLTLTNDDGVTSASIDLTEIAGGPSSDLAAGASTGLLNINDVFDAVQAADATFDLGATDKLRIDVVAEFGGSNTSSGVILSAFNLSSDGTSFNMMTDASN
jgi:hypothetical protein